MADMTEILQAQKAELDAPEADTIDTDGLTLEQIKQLAEREAQGKKPALEPRRDDQGRFKPAEDEPAEAEEEEEEPETIYVREIDLGDGSGKQRFEGKTPEEVMDKLAEAQKHATRKIREQAAELKDLKAKPTQQQSQEDKDDEFVLSQEILSKPTEAVKKAFKRATGLDISEFRTIAERVKAIDAAEAARTDDAAQNTAANAFIAAHPEYVPNQANGQRLSRAVNLLIAEAKSRGEQVDYSTILMKAYEDLSESGLLTLKSKDADSTADGTTEAAKSRIGSTRESSQKQTVRTGSSLAGRTRASAVPKKTEPSEDDLYSMPLDKLRELARQQAG